MFEVLSGPGALLIFSLLSYRFLHFDRFMTILLFLLFTLYVLSHLAGFSNGAPTPYAGDRAAAGLGLGQSKHFIGGVGFLLFLVPFWSACVFRRVQIYHVIICLAGNALIAVSLSRVYLLSVAVFLLCYFLFGYLVIRKEKHLGMAALLVPAGLIAFCLLLLTLQSLQDMFVRMPFGLSDAATTRSGITAGREWLFAQHMLIFLQNWKYGIGEFQISNYIVNGPILASTESYLSYAMARDGILGIMNYAFLLSLASFSLKSGTRFHYALSVALIPRIFFTAGLTNIYDPVTFIMFALLFTWTTRTSGAEAGMVRKLCRTGAYLPQDAYSDASAAPQRCGTWQGRGSIPTERFGAYRQFSRRSSQHLG